MKAAFDGISPPPPGPRSGPRGPPVAPGAPAPAPVAPGARGSPGSSLLGRMGNKLSAVDRLNKGGIDEGKRRANERA